MRLWWLLGAVLLTAPICCLQESLTIKGDSLQFLWEQKEGSFENISFSYQGIYFKSAKLSFKRNDLLMEDASFTTCDKPHPHYRFSTRRIKIPLAPGKQRLEVRGLSAFLGQFKLLSLPPFNLPLDRSKREGKGFLSMPRIGHSSGSGFFLGQSLYFPFAEENGRLTLVASSKRGILGHLFLPFSDNLSLSLSRKEEIVGKSVSPLFLSRTPEIGWDVFPFSLSYGRFKEEPGPKENYRFNINLSYPLLRTFSKGKSISLNMKGNASFYSDDEEYKAWGGELVFGLDSRISKTKIYLGHLSLNGSTPFIFDREEVPSYVGMDWEGERRSWKGMVRGIWDIRKGDLYDLQIRVYKKEHCLEPGISWQMKGRRLQLELGLVGF